jgi:hypothetical protein
MAKIAVGFCEHYLLVINQAGAGGSTAVAAPVLEKYVPMIGEKGFHLPDLGEP